MIETSVLGKYLMVEGFRNVKIEDVNSLFSLIRGGFGKCHVQILDAGLIAGFEHIFSAVLNALKSFKAGLNMSKSLSVEVLLFASGQDQIRRAIEILGVKPSTLSVALIIVSDDRAEAAAALDHLSKILSGEMDQGVIELTDEKVPRIIEVFNISNLEIEASMRGSLKEAVKNIVIERAALLVTQR